MAFYIEFFSYYYATGGWYSKLKTEIWKNNYKMKKNTKNIVRWGN